MSTFVRSLRPWRFWHAIRMSFPLRPRRLVAYVLLLSVPLLGAYAIAQSITVWRAYRMFLAKAQVLTVAPPPVGPLTIQQQIQFLENQISSLRSQDPQVAKAYQMTAEEWAEWNQTTIDSMTAEISSLKKQFGPVAPSAVVPLPRVSVFNEWFTAMFAPLSSTPGQTLQLPGGTISFPAPAALYSYADPLGQQFGDPLSAGLITLIEGHAWAAWAPLVLLPMCFVLLPVSRRRANVRWCHLWRAATYSAAIPVAAILAGVLFFALVPRSFPRDGLARSMASFIPTWGVTLAGVVWWAAVINHYLQIAHAWYVSVCLTILSILLIAALLWLVFPSIVLYAFEAAF